MYVFVNVCMFILLLQTTRKDLVDNMDCRATDKINRQSDMNIMNNLPSMKARKIMLRVCFEKYFLVRCCEFGWTCLMGEEEWEMIEDRGNFKYGIMWMFWLHTEVVGILHSDTNQILVGMDECDSRMEPIHSYQFSFVAYGWPFIFDAMFELYYWFLLIRFSYYNIVAFLNYPPLDLISMMDCRIWGWGQFYSILTRLVSLLRVVDEIFWKLEHF